MIARPSFPSVLTAATFVLWAGPGEAAGQEPRWLALFQDTAEVNVVNVDVFVSDREGRPVAGLGKDDFELLVDGEPTEIGNFYAVEGGGNVTPAAAGEGGLPRSEQEGGLLRLVVFVDHENITAANRRKAFQRLREVVLGLRRPDVRIMLVAHEGSAARPLVVRQGFTAVPHEIFVALDELEKASAGSRGLDVERRNLLRAVQSLSVDPGTDFADAKEDPTRLRAEAVTEARALLPLIHAYCDELEAQVRSTLGSLVQVVDMLAPVPGRKALLYVSDGLPLKPGEALLESWSDRVELLRGMAGEVSSWAEAERFDTTPELVELTARANAARITLYALDGSAPAHVERGAAESQGTFGVRTLAPFGGSNEQDSLLLMARETGGRAGLSSSSFDETLRGIFTDFDHYYSLGFAAAPEGDLDRQRSVEVRLRRRDGEVRWRRSVRVRRPEDAARQKVLAALVLGEGDERDNPLGIRLAAPEIRPAEDGRFVVPLVVEVPLGNLVLVPDKSEHSARLSLYVAARDREGRTSDVTRHLCPVRIANSEVLLALGRSMVCGVRLLMRRGEQDVAVAVRDEVADVVSLVRFTLDVPGDGGSPRRETEGSR